MNNHKQPLKQAVKAHYASKVLSESQLHDLNKILSQRPHKAQQARSITLKWASAIAASLLIFVTVSGYLHTPGVITAAYADTLKDAGINNGMPIALSQWISSNNIDAVPEQYQVEMSKFCDLDQYQTTHLRVAGAEQGKVHLFFHQGHRPLHWLNRSGSIDNMNWKLIKLRSDLTLIVMYTHDMREIAVRHILQEMLPELSA